VANVDFGTCWSCVTDLTMPAVMVTGFRVVAEAIARRWQTPRGGLIDDPNYGFDIADYINDDLDTTTLGRLAQALGAEAEKDERVQSCSCTVGLNGEQMTVSALVVTAKGPFRMVVAVSKVTTTLLRVTT
jgi:hypothetical protein